jgi:hypothetical protein
LITFWVSWRSHIALVYQIDFADALDPDIPKEGGAKRATLLKAGGPERRELPSSSCRAVLLS